MIILLTPTGARPIQFDLCAKWMKQQTYSGKVTWIIVDDALPRTTDKVTFYFRENWEIIKVYPTPIWQGQNTQARNIAAGIQFLTKFKKEEIEAIFIIEDDDYYRPNYLERMMVNFGSFSLIGERNTIYYNVLYRRYVTNPNIIHASLFQTAFKYEVIPVLQECFYHKFIDCVLWTKIQQRNLFYEGTLAIGIKGLPGRSGIGAGHSRAYNMIDDRNLIYLNSLIGEDAKIYEEYYQNAQDTNRQPLFKTL
jgi:hypothetical protein